MSWKECDWVSERREFATLALSEGANVPALCRRFGVARKTGYKWIRRFKELGEAGLVDHSKTPHSFRSPTSDDVEKLVLGVRDDQCGGGGQVTQDEPPGFS